MLVIFDHIYLRRKYALMSVIIIQLLRKELRNFRVGRQTIWSNDVFDRVQYGRFHEAYKLDFLKRSDVSQPIYVLFLKAL